MPRYRERNTKHKERGMKIYSSRVIILPDKEKHELYQKIEKEAEEYRKFNPKTK